MSEKKQFSTALTKVNDIYYPMIERQLTGNGIQFDDYSKQCVLNSISAINNVLDENNISWNHPQLDHSNITEILLKVASLKLNPSASPKEVYFEIRNVNTKRKDEKGNDIWKKQIKMEIQGDGNDAILSRFGRDVKTVHQYWLVREDDEFEYPIYNGIEMTPPKWRPKGKGKVVRVVYPIEKTNGTIEYYIAEREDVIKNLIAHVKNNMMNETFGLAKSRFEAKPDQKEKIKAKKDEIIQRIKELGLDGALNDKEIQKYISPAWKEEHSKESMIIRKMRNNIVKKIPKDFGSAYVALKYEDSTNDYEERVRKDITEHANAEVIDIIDHEEVKNEESAEELQEEQKQESIQDETSEREVIQESFIIDDKEQEYTSKPPF